MQDNIYFAAKESKDCAGILLQKGTSFFNTLRSNAYLDKIVKMWQFYYGAYDSDVGFGHEIRFTGEQGELTQLPVNHFRNIAQHILNMITANRPMMEARAVNTDYKSLAQTYLAKDILDYYMREKGLETAIKKAVEMSIVLGTGYIKLDWNATSGEEYEVDEETGEVIYEGEIEFSNISPFDVIVDGTKENWNNEWILTRTFVNKFNLMAKYPELAERINGLPTKQESSIYRLAMFSNDDTDDVPVYEFYHKKTQALPEGRYMLFCDTECVLMDTKMPYRVLPVFRIVPSEILGTPYGYSPMFDLYPVQEAINSLYSTILTNQNAFGVQNVFVKRGSDISFDALPGGLNIIEANEKPEALNLTETPAEIFKFLETLVQSAETISGVNSVTRGNPEASLKSGTALALVQSMSLQFMSGLQQNYIKLIEELGTAIIQILKDFSNTPKTIALVGKNNRPYLKEFTGDSISDINRVIVDVGNPLSRSVAGRVQMAEQMLQMKLIKSPQQYFQVMNTGRLDSMFEGEMSELLLIKSENERILDGEDVMATALDQHKLHIMEHRSVIADPELRKNAALTQKALNHIQEHIDLLRTTDPDLLMLIGEEPLQNPGAGQVPPDPMMQQQMAQQQGQGGPLPPPQGAPMAPPQGQPQQSEAMMQPGGGMAKLPQLPSPPPPFENLPVLPTQTG